MHAEARTGHQMPSFYFLPHCLEARPPMEWETGLYSQRTGQSSGIYLLQSRCTQPGTVLYTGTGDSNSQPGAHVLLFTEYLPRPQITSFTTWEVTGNECHPQLVRMSSPGSRACRLHFCFDTQSICYFPVTWPLLSLAFSFFPNSDPSTSIKGSPLLISRLAKPSQLCDELAGPG